MTPPRAAEPRHQARSARDGEADPRGGDFLEGGPSNVRWPAIPKSATRLWQRH